MPMKRIRCTALSAVLGLFFILPATGLVPSASASPLPASTSKIKKHKKHKTNKEIVLKGHHGKRSRKPA
jgi:hypothetical protein